MQSPGEEGCVIADAADETALEVAALVQTEKEQAARGDAFQLLEQGNAGNRMRFDSEILQVAECRAKACGKDHEIKSYTLPIRE